MCWEDKRHQPNFLNSLVHSIRDKCGRLARCEREQESMNKVNRLFFKLVCSCFICIFHSIQDCLMCFALPFYLCLVISAVVVDISSSSSAVQVLDRGEHNTQKNTFGVNTATITVVTARLDSTPLLLLTNIFPAKPFHSSRICTPPSVISIANALCVY